MCITKLCDEGKGTGTDMSNGLDRGGLLRIKEWLLTILIQTGDLLQVNMSKCNTRLRNI